MMPNEPLRDIMLRTMFNLEFIESRSGKVGPFEVTQLINSFLGALAHPWEQLRPELCQLDWTSAEGWPNLQKERPSDRDPSSPGDLIRLLRNGVAHGNIEFLPNGEGDIRALRIWNSNRGRRDWGAILTVRDLRSFLVGFVELAKDLTNSRIKLRQIVA